MKKSISFYTEFFLTGYHCNILIFNVLWCFGKELFFL